MEEKLKAEMERLEREFKIGVEQRDALKKKLDETVSSLIQIQGAYATCKKMLGVEPATDVVPVVQEVPAAPENK